MKTIKQFRVPVIDYKGMIGRCWSCGEIHEIRLGLCRKCHYADLDKRER